MFVRRLVLLGFCAAIGFSTPSSAEVRQFLFPTRAEKAAALEAKTEAVKEKKPKAAAGTKKANKNAAAKPKKAPVKLSRKEAAKAKLAKAEAAQQKLARRTPVREAAPLALTAAGNIGELRSETAPKKGSFLFALFGDEGEPEMLPETRALDAALSQRDLKKKFRVKPDFEPQLVEFGGYPEGTIVIDTGARYLYLVESTASARRYAIAVGRDGLQFKGKVAVGDKQEWPRWIPTLDMQKREPKKYGPYKDGMAGGPQNPLGARAIYLYQGKQDTHLRIHGTNQPETIGTSSSNGCFRMINEHVMDLYPRVPVGAKVVVL